MSDLAGTFQEYASAYDQLYRDKNYEAECAFIEAAARRFGDGPIRSVLDLGCGTGGHALPLARRGYRVVGVDRSPEMLACARSKCEQAGCLENVTLIPSDITSFTLDRRFDLVICMFAVMSYMTKNEELRKAFEVARSHVKPGGLFICDFWYGPAVMLDLPTPREKRVNTVTGEIVRTATPTIHFNENTVEVVYELTTRVGGIVTETITERHAMRYLFMPELTLLAGLSGFELVHTCDCCSLDSVAGSKTWTVSAIFRAC